MNTQDPFDDSGEALPRITVSYTRRDLHARYLLHQLRNACGWLAALWAFAALIIGGEAASAAADGHWWWFAFWAAGAIGLGAQVAAQVRTWRHYDSLMSAVL